MGLSLLYIAWKTIQHRNVDAVLVFFISGEALQSLQEVMFLLKHVSL